MNERESRRYEGRHGAHPDTCTCAVCCEKGRKKEEKREFGGKIECPKCGYLSVDYVGKQQRYICSNPECGISGDTLFELSHGATILPPRLETEIPESPEPSETRTSTPAVAPQKEKAPKGTPANVARVFLVLVLVAITGYAWSKAVPELRTAIPNTPRQTGYIDPLALNPAAESYLDQTWGGQTIHLPPEGTFELRSHDIHGRQRVQAYYDDSVVTITNHQNVRNPTMAELLVFLKEDDTENHVYSDPSFVCTNYAVILHNRAEANGIRCAFVSIRSAGSGAGHAVNAFQTTDYGLVFVDVTGDQRGTGIDKFVKITMGQEAIAVPVFWSDHLGRVRISPTLGSITSGEMWW